ncbi:MAG: SPFH domain-containing protein [Bacilli bacterium]|nr:SPFH domain-containing protein [Bacilli bacterium]
MGLIKALVGSTAGTFGDQWKEYFYCESIPVDVLMVKGQKRVNAKRSSNTKGSDNIISNGSVIAVADGQCMLIVEQGKVVELCAEPGEFVWDSSTEPSIFTGKLGERILGIFKTIGRRFTFGGDTGKDQRVYYINLKELLDNKFGTVNPVPFRIVDSKINLDIDATIKCFGVYSYRIADPITFYTKIAGNVSDEYRRSQIDAQLKNEFISKLQVGFGALSALEVRPNQVVAHIEELENAMRDALKEKWLEARGLEIVSIAISSITLPEEYQKMISDVQRTAVLRDPGMAGATLVQAQASALEKAASNEAGAMHGFVGMGFAQNAMGGQAANPQAFYGMAAQQQAQQAQQPQQQTAPQGATWTCPKCGTKVPENSKFCPECGTKKPEQVDGWKCPTCGAINKGKFCMECGAKKPAGEPLYRCDKCGWEPKDPKNPPKFCPECGDPFDDKDIK